MGCSDSCAKVLHTTYVAKDVVHSVGPWENYGVCRVNSILAISPYPLNTIKMRSKGIQVMRNGPVDSELLSRSLVACSGFKIGFPILLI